MTCGKTFGDARCRLEKDHGMVKHRDDKDWLIMWTDQGKARVKEEIKAERKAAKREGRDERPHPEWPVKQPAVPHVI
jgi:hypothetical protein